MMTQRLYSAAPKFATVLVCAALLLAAGCKKSDDEEKAPKALVYVQAEHPQQGSIAEQITGDALLAPLAQARMAAGPAVN